MAYGLGTDTAGRYETIHAEPAGHAIEQTDARSAASSPACSSTARRSASTRKAGTPWAIFRARRVRDLPAPGAGGVSKPAGASPAGPSAARFDRYPARVGRVNSTAWLSSRLTVNTHDPQTRPAPVAAHTCATVPAPLSTARPTARSFTTTQWHRITDPSNTVPPCGPRNQPTDRARSQRAGAAISVFTSDCGTLVLRERSHSPSAFACASSRSDEVAPVPSSPRMRKFTAPRLGSS